MFKRYASSLLDFANGASDPSFSQCGEDMILKFFFAGIGRKEINYLDIGANHPKKFNNTYFFYRHWNSSGVLVEPNPKLSRSIKSSRGRDTLLQCGIGIHESEEVADYFVMSWHEFNTFSKEVAEETQKKYEGRNNIEQVLQLKLLPLNEILVRHFPSGLDLLSIDVEGLDFEILKTIDFAKCTPGVICVETKVVERSNLDEVQTFLQEKGYQFYASTPINGIFVHSAYAQRK